MVGQILSYINVMDVDSSSKLIERIDRMINDLPDNNEKSSLLYTFIQKKKQVEREKNFKKMHKIKEEKVITVPPLIEKTSKKTIESSKIDVFISAYCLMKLGKLKVRIYRRNHSIVLKNPIRNEIDSMIPNLPIYDEPNRLK